MTEEVYKTGTKRASRGNNFIVLNEERRRQDHQLLHAKVLKQNLDLREVHEKSQWTEGIEAISGFYISTQLQENKWSKIKILSLNPPARYRNCKMKWIAWINNSRNFQDAESVRIGTVPRYQSICVFPTSSSSWWNAKPFYRNSEPQRWAAKHLGHTWYIGKCFLQHIIWRNWLNPGSSQFVSTIHSSLVEKNENRTPVQDQRCQSGPSAKSSVIISEGDSFKNYGADQRRLQISDRHFDNFLTPATFACLEDKIQDRGMYLFTISYGGYALDQRSGDGWFSGWISKIFVHLYSWYFECQNFEVLDARIASALNRIIHNSQFKRRISLEEQLAQKEDRVFRGRQIACMIYEYFRVIGANDSVEN